MKCEVETKDKYHDDDECSNYSDFDSASQKKTSSGRKTKPPTNVIYILSSFDDLIYIYTRNGMSSTRRRIDISCVLGHFFGSTFYDFDFYILLQFQFLHYYDFNFKPAFGYFSFFIFEFSGICYLIVFIMCESYHNNKCLIYI